MKRFYYILFVLAALTGSQNAKADEGMWMINLNNDALEKKMQERGLELSADEIYERVWNERAVNTDTVMVHVRNIREKIEFNPKEPKYLKVVWGVGYKIEKNA